MKTIIFDVIRAYHGRAHQTAGLLFGFFPDRLDAQKAAGSLKARGLDVFVCGTQVEVAAKPNSGRIPG